MKNAYRFWIFVALLNLSGPTVADTPSAMSAIELAFKACTEVDGTNMGMQDCAREALSKADALMGRIYNTMVEEFSKNSSAEVVKRLKSSQRAWIKFRDANCLFSASNMLGGSGEGLSLLTCHYYATSIRAGELERLQLQF